MYQDNGVAGGHDDDVGAGDDAGAALLQRLLDLVDDLERAQGVDVGQRLLLAGHRRRGVHQHGAVAPLQPPPAPPPGRNRVNQSRQIDYGRKGSHVVVQPKRDQNQMRGIGQAIGSR